MRLKRHQFRAWLTAKQPDEIVGLARASCGCPLARFYRATTGQDILLFEDAGYGGFIVDRGYSKRGAPGWASNFIYCVDGDEPKNVSASRALELLETCK